MAGGAAGEAWRIMPQNKDDELIAKAKDGNKEAFKELFDRHNTKILSYLYRFVGDYQKAEDITLETFLEVYNRLPYYRPEGKFLPWIYKIATNFARKGFRGKKKAKEVSFDKPVGDEQKTSLGELLADNKLRPDNEVITNELRNLIEESMAKLDEIYRSVLLICDVQGLSYDEASYILKCSKMTVGVRLFRARKLLSDILKRKGYSV